MDVILKIDIEGSNPADIQNEALMFSRIAASQQEFTVTRPEDATPEPGQKGAEI